MKPYFAILIDSFWEAVSSKILWGLLICWSILLAGLAPFGYVTEVGYEMSRGDIINSLGLAQKLAKGLTATASDRQKAISTRLSDSFKRELKEINAKSDSEQRNEALSKYGRRELANELNKLLKVRELYDPQVFETVGKLGNGQADRRKRCGQSQRVGCAVSQSPDPAHDLFGRPPRPSQRTDLVRLCRHQDR